MTVSPKTDDYWHSLLKIEVPVTVTLARKQMPVDQIIRLVPGMMIQFDKPCDTPLLLQVGENSIAEGETVKVGDKFGLRIKEILPHAEKMIPIWPVPPRPERESLV